MKTYSKVVSARTPSERVPGVNPVADWLDVRRQVCGLACRQTIWSDAPAWRLADGRIVHVTGGFFQLGGVRAEALDPSLDGIEQPIIVQREIGNLGFILRRHRGAPEFLVQAKAEPGNVGDVQLAPTVQATESNYLRRHGGAATEYLEYFLHPDRSAVVSDSRQSEQGTRFFGKYNRNMVVYVEGDGPEERPSGVWRWCAAAELLPLLRQDFAVNTDARSVFVSSDWAVFAPEGYPFARWRGTHSFGESLLDSFLAGDARADVPLAAAVEQLHALRRSVRMQARLCPIDTLREWRYAPEGIVDVTDSRFHVDVVAVRASDREVTSWEQPLLRNVGEHEVILLCQRRKGVLHFMLRGRVEIGFEEKVQYGPTLQIEGDPVDDPLAEFVGARNDLIERAGVWQSDEGGRFMHCSARYKVVEVPEGVSVPDDPFACWLTLGQIYRLVKVPGMTTNEARSVLSLLLTDI